MLTARKSYLDERKVISKEDTDYQNLRGTLHNKVDNSPRRQNHL